MENIIKKSKKKKYSKEFLHKLMLYAIRAGIYEEVSKKKFLTEVDKQELAGSVLIERALTACFKIKYKKRDWI